MEDTIANVTNNISQTFRIMVTFFGVGFESRVSHVINIHSTTELHH